MVPLGYYIVLSGILFCIGIWGVLKSRNAIVIFMGIEIMLNAVNLAIIAFSSNMHLILSRLLKEVPADQAAEIVGSATSSGQVLVFLVMTVAAAEAAVGLAIIISIFRMRDTINVDDINIMKW